MEDLITLLHFQSVPPYANAFGLVVNVTDGYYQIDLGEILEIGNV